MSENSVPLRQLLSERMAQDKEFRDEFEKHALGLRIMQLRIRKKLSQGQLAAMIGTKQSDISRMESGRYRPTLRRLVTVFVALGAESELKDYVDYLAGEVELRRPEGTELPGRRADKMADRAA